MPIYEYQCQSCDHQMEALQKISEGPLTDCPNCGKPDLRKKVSAAAFRLKGGGWYETDFKTSSKKNLAGEQGSGSDGAASAGDSKPAAKPEASSPGGDKGGNAKNTTTG